MIPENDERGAEEMADHPLHAAPQALGPVVAQLTIETPNVEETRLHFSA